MTTPLTTDLWIDFIGICLAFAGVGFTSLMETALVSINPVRLRQLVEAGHPTAPIVERLVKQPQRLLGGQIILINTFVLLAANLATVAAHRHWGAQSVFWANLTVLVLLLLFGEVTPKTLSVNFAEGIALRTARAADLLDRLLGPLVLVLNGIGFALLRVLTVIHVLPGHVHPAPTAFSEEDIKQLVSVGEQSGEFEASERAMIHGVIEFADTAAQEIMVPRTDLIALPIDATLPEAIDTFMTSGHSRIPVYEENVDNILGLLYVKDLLIRLNARTDQSVPPLSLAQVIRPAYFVPETKKSDELLREMQRKHVHMAIVVDEYGGTAGIVTIEDLLEEIVGEIIDEYDQELTAVTFLPDGSAIISGRASLEIVREKLQLSLPRETNAETISGLVTERLGRIPDIGDQIIISGRQFTVTVVEHNRVERLLVRRTDEHPSPKGGDIA
ncbi:MAG TPA: hemolysin family protein [Armatimonadota bacterium]|jgi:CBS domain containing-hemolysin-like protein